MSRENLFGSSQPTDLPIGKRVRLTKEEQQLKKALKKTVAFRPRLRLRRIAEFSHNDIDSLLKKAQITEESEPAATEAIIGMKRYLNGEIITDSFETHVERRVWQKPYLQNPVFKSIYEDVSQLSRNNIFLPVMGMFIFANELQDTNPKLSKTLREKSDYWFEAIENYPGNMNIKEKIKFVRKLEKDTIFVLNKLFPNNPKKIINIS